MSNPEQVCFETHRLRKAEEHRVLCFPHLGAIQPLSWRPCRPCWTMLKVWAEIGSWRVSVFKQSMHNDELRGLDKLVVTRDKYLQLHDAEAQLAGCARQGFVQVHHWGVGGSRLSRHECHRNPPPRQWLRRKVIF